MVVKSKIPKLQTAATIPREADMIGKKLSNNLKFNECKAYPIPRHPIKIIGEIKSVTIERSIFYSSSSKSLPLQQE